MDHDAAVGVSGLPTQAALSWIKPVGACATIMRATMTIALATPSLNNSQQK